ncbi:hypothetical protein A8U91_03811 [Halomonas elongata]|uniref:Uncharacterized protein n=1 Tax=Halomonas elongata TaxID=2746 RepID=A0A1B8NXK0_HALEL|nr:hypothetical protein A8U91_03811 [Halomonas elongata]
MGDSHLDQHVTRRREAADLPAIHGHVVSQAIAAQGRLPEGGRRDVVHVASGRHLVALDLGFGGGFLDFRLADAGGMYISLMGQVHEVVDHQAIIAVDVVEPAAVGPGRVVGPVQLGNQGGIGLVRVAGPDPYEAMTLFHRVGANAREAAHPLAGHAGTLAVAAHLQAVIAADQLAVAHETQRQRRTTVGAEILHGRHASFVAAKEDDRFVADGTSSGLSSSSSGVQATYQVFLG